VAVLLATQIPDVIDKPLALMFHVLPSGRSFAHSFLIAIPLVGLLWFVLSRLDQEELRTPVAIGYISAIVTDLPSDVLRGHIHDATFVLWPLLPLPEYETQPTFGAHLARLQLSTELSIELVAGLAVLLVLIYNLARQPRA